MILRPYQQQAIVDIRAASWRQGRGGGCVYVLPTGGGKTVIFCEVARRAVEAGRRVLIVEHRRELLAQTHAALERAGIRPGLIAAGRAPDYSRPVQLAMIQTLARRLDGLREHMGAVDLLVIDEAHRAMATTWRRVAEACTHAWRLLVTATPIRLDGKGLGELVGEIVHGPTVAQLQDLGHLVACELYSVPPDAQPNLDGLATRAGDYDAADMADRYSVPNVMGEVVGSYRRHADGRAGIVFCCNVKHSKVTAEAFRAGGYRAAHLDGKTPTAARELILDDLAAGRIDVVTSVAVLCEGFDCPRVSYIGVCRSTQSTGLWLQIIGRGLRPYPDKDRCIVVDHGANYDAHGLPEDERTWTLDGRKPKIRAEADALRQCAVCFAVYDPKQHPDECPRCGAVVERRERQPTRIDESLPIQKITAEMRAATAFARAQKQKENQEAERERNRQIPQQPAPSWADPLIWDDEEAKRIARGYKPGYTYHACRRRMEWRKQQRLLL